MKNESSRVLEWCLSDLEEYCDEIVILDDASTDESVEVAKSFDKVTVYELQKSIMATNEAAARSIIWKSLLPKHKPTHVLSIDCDEVIDPRFKEEKDKWLDLKYPNQLMFNMVECWGSFDKVRIDKGWNPTSKQVNLLVRWLPQVNYMLSPLHLHSGRIPLNQPDPLLTTPFYVVHLGYGIKGEIGRKREYYSKRDPNANPMMQAHYDSMWDEDPVLMDLDYFCKGVV